MDVPGRYSGTLRYVAARWPTYLVGYGGIAALALLLVIAGTLREWWGLLPLALALILVGGYFFAASLWAAYQQYDKRQHLDYHVLFQMGQFRSTDDFVHVSLGRRYTAIGLSRRLTGGHVTVVDVYNPQLAPGRVLARARRQAPPPPPDPRLTWLDGSIELLPLPDNSVPAVTMSRTLSDLWQRGDQMRLLKQIHRILEPGGQLLLLEPIRSQTQWLVRGPAGVRLPPASHWRTLLDEAGFEIRKERSLGGLAHCFRATTPLPGAVEQLQFDFGL